MKRTLITLGALAFAAPAAHAESATPGDKDIDAIVQRLESSGKLEAALERLIQKRAMKQQEAARKQQEMKLAHVRETARGVRKPDPKLDHILGNPDAIVTLILFSDYECPFCKRLNGVPEEVVKRLDGRANLVWRHFPLDFHGPAAQREAEAAECVAKLGGNEAFWNYTHAVMTRTESNGKGLPAADGTDPLAALVGELKLDWPAVKRCIDSGEMKARIAADIEDGARAGVEGTPATIILNNKTGKLEVASGALPPDTLEAGTRSVLEP